MLKARSRDPQFERVHDPRRRRPRRGWRLQTVLQSVLAAMAVGARALADIEALFGGRTLRREVTRLTPWRDLLRWIYNALIAANDDDVAGLRDRGPPSCLDGTTSLPT